MLENLKNIIDITSINMKDFENIKIKLKLRLFNFIA